MCTAKSEQSDCIIRPNTQIHYTHTHRHIYIHIFWEIVTGILVEFSDSAM